jgi:hypothetical protein
VPPVVEEGDVERPGVADGQGVANPRSGGAGEVLAALATPEGSGRRQ